MSLHKHAELKEAVLSLPQKEKDKLLVRLINKDKMLLKQLHFELLEDEFDLEARITDLKNGLENLYNEQANRIKNIPTYANYKYLNALMRQASGMVNEHERITKDKFSVVESRLIILQEAFDRYPLLFSSSNLSPAVKLHKYANARMKNVVKIFDNLHEDLQFDLNDLMEYVLNFAHNHQLDLDL